MALRFVLSLFFERNWGADGDGGGGCRGSMNLEGRGGGMLFKNGRMWRGTGGGAGWGGDRCGSWMVRPGVPDAGRRAPQPGPARYLEIRSLDTTPPLRSPLSFLWSCLFFFFFYLV